MPYFDGCYFDLAYFDAEPCPTPEPEFKLFGVFTPKRERVFVEVSGKLVGPLPSVSVTASVTPPRILSGSLAPTSATFTARGRVTPARILRQRAWEDGELLN